MKIISLKDMRYFLFVLWLSLSYVSLAQESYDPEKIRVQQKSNSIIRVTFAKYNTSNWFDSRWETVEKFTPEPFDKVSTKKSVKTYRAGKLKVIQESSHLKVSYKHREICLDLHVLADSAFFSHTITKDEVISGLGHHYMGASDTINFNGQTQYRNYGHNKDYNKPLPSWRQQAPLLVPFFISSRGYGVFLNSQYPNYFHFTEKSKIGIRTVNQDAPQLDVFIFFGSPKEILKQYLEITGKPACPPLSVFGLQLSDKSHEKTENPSDEEWWRKQVKTHRENGYALDHLVNDNRWRAGGGTRCESRFEWELERYPDPKKYGYWLDSMGLTITLDFNRCISKYCKGWNKSFNIPLADSVDYPEFRESRPDFTNPEVREWFWNTISATTHDKGYPVGGLWIDEFDAHRTMPYETLLYQGTWASESNYYYFLIGKALYEEGWGKYVSDKRPYIWVRGMSAGAQRFGTLWSGDIYPNTKDYKRSIRSAQLAGISGFPYWGHDAGGFKHDKKNRLTDTLYARWAIQMGAFSPIWKPHGLGPSRWPMDRNELSQEIARRYIMLRYKLMAYTYTYALRAALEGEPIVRPMYYEFPEQEEAWQHGLQYMWGADILVAPIIEGDTCEIWLPEGKWIDFWTNEAYDGGKVITYQADIKTLPLFVKDGAIIPMYKYVLSTKFIDFDQVELHIFGEENKNTRFELWQDDGKSYVTSESIKRTMLVPQVGNQNGININLIKGYKE